MRRVVSCGAMQTLGERVRNSAFNGRPIRHDISISEAEYRVAARRQFPVVGKVALPVGRRRMESEAVELDDEAVAHENVHAVAG